MDESKHMLTEDLSEADFKALLIETMDREARQLDDHPTPDVLLAFRSDELDREMSDEVLRHIGVCHECSDQLLFYAAATEDASRPSEREIAQVLGAMGIDSRAAAVADPTVAAAAADGAIPAAETPSGPTLSERLGAWTHSIGTALRRFVAPDPRTHAWNPLRLGAELAGAAALLVLGFQVHDANSTIAAMASPQANVMVQELDANRYRGAETTSDGFAELGADDHFFTLVLAVEPELGTYEVSISDRGTGRELWHHPDLVVDRHGIATLGLSPHFFDTDALSIRVLAPESDTAWTFAVDLPREGR